MMKITGQMRKIESLWNSLRQTGISAQKRIDSVHAHYIYADFDPPDQVGMVVVCKTRAEEPKPLRSLEVTVGQRADHQWSLRVCLNEPALQPVFSALCEDVISSTEVDVSDADLADVVSQRIQHWLVLLERDSAGLGETTLQGLIGELVILDRVASSRLPLAAAIESWTGPFGAPQDFRLPSGERIEVKAVRNSATSVRVNGLGQLDGGGDPLHLAIVRMQATAPSAPGAVTASALIERLRRQTATDTSLRRLLDKALAALHWHDHPSHDEFAVRILCVEAYPVDQSFPKLTATSVPSGVLEANYVVALIGDHENW